MLPERPIGFLSKERAASVGQIQLYDGTAAISAVAAG